jgi:hypothetical protein
MDLPMHTLTTRRTEQEWTGMDRIGQEQTGLFDHLQNKKTNFG